MIISGQPGWGIAWYINDTLVPELVVERGQTYTFLVHGGNVPVDDANYHPFYITDSVAQQVQFVISRSVKESPAGDE